MLNTAQKVSLFGVILVREKAVQLAKKTLEDGVDGNVKEKVLRCLKPSHFEKDKLFPTYVMFFNSSLSAIGR